MSANDKIILKGMLFSASVGVSDWERDVPTSLEVDLELQADLQKACMSDNLHDTINYSELYDLVGETVGSRHHNLLESLAQEIADGVLKQHACRSVIIRIRKPHPPVKGVCAYAEVEITRSSRER
ncbi:MAG: dihydroneopterin aldolase [Candidatus Abyssobacteria bacterium SURF_5]|uniref:7,8-dihydroneopterin aldolase n=1 Tax=Abyssobacteria bacterium (strain SURF_5) TaxID=2093360 RepID=A0A3A4PDK5_ABYX5|nr:MAG: dihydroneopterin aldolase [Candidatus Abyssubacteria bacterium SURF_5]